MPFPLPLFPVDLDRDALIRVDEPAHVEAAASSATGAVLFAPPTDGTPWEWESVPHLDESADEVMLQAINASPWHERGALGQGVQVAIFDFQFEGAASLADELGDVRTHDCWVHRSCAVPLDTTRPRFDFERGRHGTACAEIVRDVAPEAQLHLVRVNSRTMFENAVDWAIREDIDVISMSMSFFNLSYFDGRGPLADELDRLERSGTLLVTSAGNYARSHWQHSWTDGNGDGWHDLDGTGGLPVRVNAGGGRVYVTWNQYADCGDTDLDAELIDEHGRIVARGDAEQSHGDEAPRCRPVEILGPVPERGWYTLRVRHRRGPVADLSIDVMAPGGRIEGAMPQTSIVDPGLHPAALTVGAVNLPDYLRADISPSSSQGPSITGLPKPDIAAPDGLTTRSFGTGGFSGTSASTPVIAGMVAVVMSDEPGLTPYEAADRLRGWAWSDGALGAPDDRWGAGKARLPVQGDPPACGRRPLLLPLVVLPLGWLRRRRRGTIQSSETQ